MEPAEFLAAPASTPIDDGTELKTRSESRAFADFSSSSTIAPRLCIPPLPLDTLLLKYFGDISITYASEKLSEDRDGDKDSESLSLSFTSTTEELDAGTIDDKEAEKEAEEEEEEEELLPFDVPY